MVFSDEVTEKSSVIVGKELLTDFQQDKFKYFFYHVLDLNRKHEISHWSKIDYIGNLVNLNECPCMVDIPFIDSLKKMSVNFKGPLKKPARGKINN